jgi:alanine-synthesizing transaminase
METTPRVQLAQRMSQLPPYLFGMINKMKMEKRWRGDDVIDLGMGNPVDPTPHQVIEKLVEVANDPKAHRYPVADGMRNLRREIAKNYRQDYGVDLNPDANVICTIGSKEGISHMCLALIGPGDSVLVPAPAFPVHIYAAIIAGGSVIRIPLTREDAFIEQIRLMCENVSSRPKVLILNYPHNPTGIVCGISLFERIVRLAKRYDFVVIQDFAYAKITFDGYQAPSFLQAPGAMDVGVEFGSFSKSYNMAGWRLGYCVGNADLVAGLRKIKGYYDYGVVSAVQVAGIMALRHCEEDIAKQVGIYQSRRDTLCEALERIGWPVTPPQGGMFVWAKIPAPFDRMGSMNFAIEMMNRANVALAPGIGFGEEGEGHVRIALVENEHRIRQAARQMRRAMQEMEELAPGGKSD